MLSRRNFLQSSLLCALSLSPLSLQAAKAAHVVIVGAGWGGLSAAKTLRSLNKECQITVIEKQDKFISCPMSNWVVGQIKDMDQITFSYKNFIKNNNINMIFDTVKNINTNSKILNLENTKVSYDKLILSPGISIEYETVDGLKNALNKNSIFTAWKAGEETSFLAKRIKVLTDEENVVISIPLSPYRCPPGPYERASLIASYIKQRKLKSKVIILDANQKIISKGKLFSQAWESMYPDIIEYRPDSNVIAINKNKKLIYTDFDEYKFDVANIIPKQRAPKILNDAGLIDNKKKWAPVNPYDFSSNKVKDLYIIGDATDRASVGSVPKSGYIAYSMGKVCGYAVYSSLIEKKPPSPSMINTCYSLVAEMQGISVSAVYKYNNDKNKIVPVKNASGLSPESSEIIANNGWDWAQAIWKDMLS